MTRNRLHCIASILCFAWFLLMSWINIHFTLQPLTREPSVVSLEDPNLGLSASRSLPLPSTTSQGDENQRTPSIHSCMVHNHTYTIPTAPHFVIIGVQKSGTTAMADYLVQHPNILDTKKAGREPHFFDNVFLGLEHWYRDGKYTSEEDMLCDARQRYANFCFRTQELMEAVANDTLLMSFDKTPSYIHLPNAAKNLHRTCPWLTKVIVILRNPVDRAYSQYRMNIRDRTNKRTWLDFEHHINQEIETMNDLGLTNAPLFTRNDSLVTLPPHDISPEGEEELFAKLKGPPLLRKGLYSIQLRQWLQYFPYPNSLMVLKFEDLYTNPHGMYSQILQHVGLPDYDLPLGYPPLHTGEYEPMANETRRFLETFFQPYNRRLANILDEEWKGVWE